MAFRGQGVAEQVTIDQLVQVNLTWAVVDQQSWVKPLAVDARRQACQVEANDVTGRPKCFPRQSVRVRDQAGSKVERQIAHRTADQTVGDFLKRIVQPLHLSFAAACSGLTLLLDLLYL